MYCIDFVIFESVDLNLGMDSSKVIESSNNYKSGCLEKWGSFDSDSYLSSESDSYDDECSKGSNNNAQSPTTDTCRNHYKDGTQRTLGTWLIKINAQP